MTLVGEEFGADERGRDRRRGGGVGEDAGRRLLDAGALLLQGVHALRRHQGRAIVAFLLDVLGLDVAFALGVENFGGHYNKQFFFFSDGVKNEDDETTLLRNEQRERKIIFFFQMWGERRCQKFITVTWKIF